MRPHGPRINPDTIRTRIVQMLARRPLERKFIVARTGATRPAVNRALKQCVESGEIEAVEIDGSRLYRLVPSTNVAPVGGADKE